MKVCSGIEEKVLLCVYQFPCLLSLSQSYDVSGLQLTLVERHSEMPHTSRSAMPCIVPDRDSKPTR